MQNNCIILKGKILHLPELNKNNSVHIFRFRLPIYFKHWTHLFVFLRKNLQLIVQSIPSLNKGRSVMLLHLVVTMLKFDNLLTETLWILTFIHLFLFRLFLCSFAGSFFALFRCAFILDIIFIKWVFSKIVITLFLEIKINFSVS